jgi:hypothetical protein
MIGEPHERIIPSPIKPWDKALSWWLRGEGVVVALGSNLSTILVVAVHSVSPTWLRAPAQYT